MDSKAVSRWCDARREAYAAGGGKQWIEIADPCRLRKAERDAIASRCARFNLSLYRFARARTDPDALSAFASEMGLERRDLTLGADRRGIAQLRVARIPRGPEMIPFTSRALNWHTDGYYNAPGRSVRAVVMHCAAPAASGGENALLDPDLVYAAMHEQDPALVEALAHPRAMTIPQHEADGVVVRPARTGPVFRFLDDPPCLHMRYTMRTRSIRWRTVVGHRSCRRRARSGNPLARGASGARAVRGGRGRDLQQRAAPSRGIRRRRGFAPDRAEDPLLRPGLVRVARTVFTTAAYPHPWPIPAKRPGARTGEQ